LKRRVATVKKVEKRLDKLRKVWYNRGTVKVIAYQAKFEKNLKKGLTSKARCDIINTTNG